LREGGRKGGRELQRELQEGGRDGREEGSRREGGTCVRVCVYQSPWVVARHTHLEKS